MSRETTVGSDYSAIYDPDADFDAVYTEATAERIAQWVRDGDRVLELGSATGLMTTRLAAAGAGVVCVERSAGYLEIAAARRPGALELIQADIDAHPWPEEVGGGFRHVVVCNLLHELADPTAALAAAAERLADGGLVHVTLQNPRSLHRLIALEMGLIDSLGEVSERGRRFGTRALWGGDDLAALMRESGLRVVSREGVMLKPLPNDAMRTLPAEVVEGFRRAAWRLPEHCAMNYLVGRRA